MEGNELIFSIVCDTAPVFYSKEELSILLLVSKECANSQTVKKSICLWKARYLIDQLYENTISLVCETNKEEYERREKNILIQVDASDFMHNCFNMKLISGYKEMAYNEINDPYFSNIDYDIMKQYERIIGSEETVRSHMHDPEHPVFDDGEPHHFSFYYSCEMYGYSVMDLESEDVFDEDSETSSDTIESSNTSESEDTE